MRSCGWGSIFLVPAPPIFRHCERSETIHSAAGGEMDCFAALAMTWIQFRVLAARSPEVCNFVCPLEYRGRREDRVLAAPAVSRAICANKTAHEHTGQREHSGLPCAMALRLTSCSSRRTAFLPPSPALLIASLTPAPRRPNHTTSPYASRALACTRFASIASHRTFVTIASAPHWVRRAEKEH